MQSRDSNLLASKGEEIHRIGLEDIYYFEAVEKKVFVYDKDEVYEMKEKLYQIEERFENSSLVRVSKSVILNVDKIEVIYPALSGRFEVKLDNGEKVSISRNYVPELKRKLGMEGV